MAIFKGTSFSKPSFWISTLVFGVHRGEIRHLLTSMDFPVDHLKMTHSGWFQIEASCPDTKSSTGGFFTPDVAASDRRIITKFAQVIGPILLYVARYKIMEAKLTLTNNHRAWKPHSCLKELLEKGKLDADFYRTLKAVTLLMRWSLGTTDMTETGRIIRSVHGLASGVAGHSAITKWVKG